MIVSISQFRPNQILSIPDLMKKNLLFSLFIQNRLDSSGDSPRSSLRASVAVG